MKAILRKLLTDACVWLTRPRKTLRELEIKRAHTLRNRARLLWADMRSDRTITEIRYREMEHERMECINEANRLAKKHQIPELIAAAYAR